jgi:tRNA G18 (ribose-2'-O)-methylase SpoU
MIRIPSLDDPRVADYRQLANPDALARAGLFVAEGRLVVRRLLANGRFVTRSVLVTEVAFDALRDVLERTQADVFVVDQRTMNEIAGFNIHRGCLALAERPAAAELEDLPLDGARLLVVLEGVNNPDNVGGIFRSAAAFGADAVILGPSCSDPLYRKSVRTSMAATLAVPFATAGAWPQAIGVLRSDGFTVVALTPASDAIAIEDLPRHLDRVAILVGAEGEGLSDGAMAAADYRVRIPMTTMADSLNVTVAASIALYRLSTPSDDAENRSSRELPQKR